MGIFAWGCSVEIASQSCGALYDQLMAIQLTPDQEAAVRRAVERGVAGSAEDVVNAALRLMDLEADTDLEQRLGMSRDELNRELDKGRVGPFGVWEGAKQFTERMREKHQGTLSGRPAK